MGACDFSAVAWGKDAREAFRSAVDDARWEHGHGGYTGTIAEKGDFVLFTLPPRMKAETFQSLVFEAMYDGGDVEYARDDLRRAEAWLRSKPTGHVRAAQKSVRDAKARLARYEREHAKLARKLGGNADLIRRAAAVANDKWGPAVAVEVTSPAERARWTQYHAQARRRADRLFLFFGMASS